MLHWTVGKKLYTCGAALGVVILVMAAASAYLQRRLGADIEELTGYTAPNLQRAEELTYLTEAYRVANRNNVILAMQQDGSGIARNTERMAEILAAFVTKAKELEESTHVPAIKARSRDAVQAMEAFAAKCQEIGRLATEMHAAGAAAKVAEAAPLGNRVQGITARIAGMQVERLASVAGDAQQHQALGPFWRRAKSWR